MAILIPLCFLLLMLFLSGRMIGGIRFGFGHAFTTAIIMVFLWVIISTVALSWVHALSFWPVLFCWLGPCLALLAQLKHNRASCKDLFGRLKRIIRGHRGLFWALAAVVTIFALGTFLSATLYPVSNGDSLSMHLPRVFFAIQARSVAPYPTSVIQQLITYPLCSWTITQVVILSRSSYWAVNLIQWACYVPSALLCVLIARKMQAGAKGQAIALLTALTVTGAILQASTTQYDLLFALTALAAIYFCLCLIAAKTTSGQTVLILLLGISLGVSLVAKVTIAPLFLPFFIWLAIILCKTRSLKTALLNCLMVILLAVVVASPWLIRNAADFNGDVLLSRQSYWTSIPDKSPGAVWANMWRAFFMEFSTPIARLNQAFEQPARIIGGALGTPLTSTLDTEAPGHHFALSTSANIHHDQQASPFTLWLILTALITVIIMRKSPPHARPYGVCALGGFLLTGTLITWQPYLARTLTPALMAGAPFVGVVAETAFMRRSAKATMARILFAVLLIGSLSLGGLALCYNRTNPLLPDSWLGLPAPYPAGWWDTPREELAYKVTTPTLGPAIQAMRTYLTAHSPHNVLFIGDRIDTDGPTWPLLQLFSPGTVVSQAGTMITPASRRFTPTWHVKAPDLIVSQGTQEPSKEQLVYQGVTYARYRAIYVAARPNYYDAQWLTLWMR